MRVPNEGIDYKINLKIEKYHTKKALSARIPDEILNVPGNCLTNKGIDLIWKLVSDTPLINNGTDGGRYEWAFDHSASFIGVGNVDNNPPTATSSIQPKASDTKLYAEEYYDSTDTSLTACHYCYMGMNDTYPIAGQNQKIVFQSTFLPGVACFNWYEWCIANGNGNLSATDMEADQFIIRNGPLGPPDNDIDDVAPDPIPTRGSSYVPVDTDTREKKTLLNHRMESMGRKYASATWIITVEVSLS